MSELSSPPITLAVLGHTELIAILKLAHFSGTCGKCTEWLSESCEIRANEEAYRLEVGKWSTVQGFEIKDDLFPHVSGGLRSRTITISSIEVPI
jgi:hypothetical protein